MKKVLSAFSLVLALTVPMCATAHEGHDHDAPVSVKAPKGGVVKELEKTYVEVVSKAKELKIYLYDKEMKPRATEGFKITAVAELPRKRGSRSVELKDLRDHFAAEYDAKGAHRYSLNLKIFDPVGGHEDAMSFTIEPRK
jgi:hypothetical protein